MNASGVDVLKEVVGGEGVEGEQLPEGAHARVGEGEVNAKAAETEGEKEAGEANAATESGGERRCVPSAVADCTHPTNGAEAEEMVREEGAVALAGASGLPPVLKERLLAEISTGGNLASVVRTIEEWLPEFMRSPESRGTRGPAAQRQHPSGDAFFHGNGGDISDTEAEEVARRQLERSGLLRGQRARG